MPLTEIHIHIPAEHLVDGSEHYPMEMQVASRHPIKSRVEIEQHHVNSP